MANIVVSQVGLSTRLQQSEQFMSRDVRGFFSMFCPLFPEHTFWYIGPVADIKTLDSAKLPSNLRIMWRDVPTKQTPIERVEWVKANAPVVDLFILFMGPTGVINIPGKFKRLDGQPFKTMLFSERYVAPIIEVVNSNPKARIIELYADPRCELRNIKDMLVPPTLQLSQRPKKVKNARYKGYTDQTTIKEEGEFLYFPIQALNFIMDLQKPRIQIPTNRAGFQLVLNSSSKADNAPGAIPRLPILQEWILKNFPDVEIYGKWDKKICGEDPRFKGSISTQELEQKMASWHSSFCIPMSPNFVTTKYLELIRAGVIPFLHPQYDGLGLTKIPEILRIKTPEDLKNGIELFSADKTAYSNLWNELLELYYEDLNYAKNEMSALINELV